MINIEKTIEQKWGFANVAVLRTLQKNGGRTVYLIRAHEGDFVLKIFHPELTCDKIERYTGVLLFLEKIGFRHAPKIIKLPDHSAYTKAQDRYIYLMEYIYGVEVCETLEDEYQLGIALAKLHNIKGCTYHSGVDPSERINNMLSRFEGYPFKDEYNRIVMNLPDFAKLKQSFIHTDICPQNALKRSTGEMMLIDFDDAGIGSTFIDLGYPLIAQFVQFENREVGQNPPDINRLRFNFKMAKSFYDGYFSVNPMVDCEKKFIFDGAVFMQLMYMPCFGDEAVPFLWRELTFALENKSLLLEALGVKG